jgi:serine O-acetyltransferase
MPAVLERVTPMFDPDREYPTRGVLALIISDYLAYYARFRESPRRLALMFAPRMVANASMHATALMRLALGGPAVLMPLWRTLLLALHTIDIQHGMQIGPGLRLPHPWGLTCGPDVVLGRDVTLYHNVNIGARSGLEDVRLRRHELGSAEHRAGERFCPHLEDEVIVLMCSTVLGPITIGRGAIIGAGSWIEDDLPPASVHRGQVGRR